MRTFKLVSSRDGEAVAEGVIFSNGKVAVCWQRQGFPGSVVVWDCIADAALIHTGVGAWQIVYQDER